jgi:monoamine oxidase
MFSAMLREARRPVPATDRAGWSGLFVLTMALVVVVQMGCQKGPRRGPPGERGAAPAPPGEAPVVDAPLPVRGEEIPQLRHRAQPPTQVVIVGGGLAGLITAYALEKRGIAIRLLEASDVFGGRVVTADYGPGLHAEAGLQEVWADSPLMALAQELKVPLERDGGAAYSSVILDGKLHPSVHPTSAAFLASLFDDAERAAYRRWLGEAERLYQLAEREGLRAPAVAELQRQSFAAWVERAGLPRRVAAFIRLGLECEVAADWQQVSALAGLLDFKIFFGEGLASYHARGGNGRLVEALVRALRGPLLPSATVVRVERRADDRGRPRVRVYYRRGHALYSVDAERAVLAVPFFRLHQILIDPPLPPERWQAIRSLGRGQYVVVHLLIDRRASALWTVGGRSSLPVLSDGRLGVIYGVVGGTQEPGPPLLVFSLLIHGGWAQAFHMQPHEAKVREVVADLERLWPGFAGHVRSSHVYTYHPGAIAVFGPGRSPLDAAAQRLREPDRGVYLVGDWTIGTHSDGAARSALDAAARIAAEIR